MYPANRPCIERCATINFFSQGFQNELAGFLRHRAIGHTVSHCDDETISIIASRRKQIDRDIALLKDFPAIPQRILLVWISAKVLRLGDINNHSGFHFIG